MNTSPATESVKDEGTIQFRPSPNFKHMKKYLKSKFEEDMNSSAENSEAKDKVNTSLQPPLPPNSPPPDSPPPALALVKLERPDDEYEPAPPPAAAAAAATPAPAGAPAAVPATAGDDGRKKIMCRDFVRKTCTRGAACIHLHEIIHSQLKDVYKFCRDYENGRCNRPVCYFVHATTFEKEHYHRSAKLPPHAFAHLPAADGVTKLPTFKYPSPAKPFKSAKAAAAPASTAAPSPAPATAPAAAPAPAVALASAAACVAPPSLKREWRDIDDYGAPRGCDAKEPAKQCKRCDLTKLRLAAARGRVATARRGARELDGALDGVLRRNQRLLAALRVLLKSRRELETARGGSLAARLLGDDHDKDQVKVLLAKILLGGDGAPAAAAEPGT